MGPHPRFLIALLILRVASGSQSALADDPSPACSVRSPEVLGEGTLHTLLDVGEAVQALVGARDPESHAESRQAEMTEGCLGDLSPEEILFVEAQEQLHEELMNRPGFAPEYALAALKDRVQGFSSSRHRQGKLFGAILGRFAQMDRDDLMEAAIRRANGRPPSPKDRILLQKLGGPRIGIRNPGAFLTTKVQELRTLKSAGLSIPSSNRATLRNFDFRRAWVDGRVRGALFTFYPELRGPKGDPLKRLRDILDPRRKGPVFAGREAIKPLRSWTSARTGRAISRTMSMESHQAAIRLRMEGIFSRVGSMLELFRSRGLTSAAEILVGANEAERRLYEGLVADIDRNLDELVNDFGVPPRQLLPLKKLAAAGMGQASRNQLESVESSKSSFVAFALAPAAIAIMSVGGSMLMAMASGIAVGGAVALTTAAAQTVTGGGDFMCRLNESISDRFGETFSMSVAFAPVAILSSVKSAGVAGASAFNLMNATPYAKYAPAAAGLAFHTVRHGPTLLFGALGARGIRPAAEGAMAAYVSSLQAEANGDRAMGRAYRSQAWSQGGKLIESVAFTWMPLAHLLKPSRVPGSLSWEAPEGHAFAPEPLSRVGSNRVVELTLEDGSHATGRITGYTSEGRIRLLKSSGDEAWIESSALDYSQTQVSAEKIPTGPPPKSVIRQAWRRLAPERFGGRESKARLHAELETASSAVSRLSREARQRYPDHDSLVQKAEFQLLELRLAIDAFQARLRASTLEKGADAPESRGMRALLDQARLVRDRLERLKHDSVSARDAESRIASSQAGREVLLNPDNLGISKEVVRRISAFSRKSGWSIAVRISNPASLQYFSHEGYLAKPASIPFKTATRGPWAGLVVEPRPEYFVRAEAYRKAQAVWDSAHWEQFKGTCECELDAHGVLRSTAKSTKNWAYHSDLDLLAVFDRKTGNLIHTGNGQSGQPGAEKVQELNDGILPKGADPRHRLFTHGAEVEYHEFDSIFDPKAEVVVFEPGARPYLSEARPVLQNAGLKPAQIPASIHPTN